MASAIAAQRHSTSQMGGPNLSTSGQQSSPCQDFRRIYGMVKNQCKQMIVRLQDVQESVDLNLQIRTSGFTRGQTATADGVPHAAEVLANQAFTQELLSVGNELEATALVLKTMARDFHGVEALLVAINSKTPQIDAPVHQENGGDPDVVMAVAVPSSGPGQVAARPPQTRSPVVPQVQPLVAVPSFSRSSLPVGNLLHGKASSLGSTTVKRPFQSPPASMQRPFESDLMGTAAKAEVVPRKQFIASSYTYQDARKLLEQVELNRPKKQGPSKQPMNGRGGRGRGQGRGRGRGQGRGQPSCAAIRLNLLLRSPESLSHQLQQQHQLPPPPPPVPASTSALLQEPHRQQQQQPPPILAPPLPSSVPLPPPSWNVIQGDNQGFEPPAYVCFQRGPAAPPVGSAPMQPPGGGDNQLSIHPPTLLMQTQQPVVAPQNAASQQPSAVESLQRQPGLAVANVEADPRPQQVPKTNQQAGVIAGNCLTNDGKSGNNVLPPLPLLETIPTAIKPHPVAAEHLGLGSANSHGVEEAEAAEDMSPRCQVCAGAAEYCCPTCENFVYCSEDCQDKHWWAGHGLECQQKC